MTDNPETGVPQADPLPDAAKVVDAFGGVRPMAAHLGIAATTIQGWKSRGNIPEGRRQQVIDAARAAGIDLTAIEGPAIEADIEPPEAEQSPDLAGASQASQPPAGSSGRVVAWIALVIAAGVGALVLTQSQWSGAPAVATPSAVDEITARLSALEGQPKTDLAPILTKIEALEARLAELEARPAAPAPEGPATPDLTPRLDALSAQRLQDSERIGSLSRQFEEFYQSMRSEDKTEALAAELETIRNELAALGSRIDTAAATTRDAGGGAAAQASLLVLAAAGLHDAVMSGGPFDGPLSVVRQLAGSDTVLLENVTVLEPLARAGVPTVSQLRSEFQSIAGSAGAPLWSSSGVGWIDEMMGKVDSLVTIRRLEDGQGQALPAVKAKRALEVGDLPGAVAAMQGAAGDGAAWVARAKSRLAADRAVAALRQRGLEIAGTAHAAAKSGQQ